MDLIHFVKWTYVLGFAGIIVLELTKSARLAVFSARLAILMALLGSSTWVYAAYLAPHRSAPFASHAVVQTFASDEESERTRTDLSEDDCLDCPAMVHVAAGLSSIGASEDDPQATQAEKPQHNVRVWPGFAISQEAISSKSYAQFLLETGRPKRTCVVPGASSVAQNKIAEAGASSSAAHCVALADAEAYAGWLTERSGRRFRLPSAVEWEYAVRKTPSPVLRISDVAELVADCWRSRLPDPAIEALTAHAENRVCAAHVLMGGASSDDARWRRPSARRRFDGESAAIDVGFRVVRED